MAERVRLDRRAIAEAVTGLDMRLVSVGAASLGRTGIYRCLVASRSLSGFLPTGVSVVATHVSREQDSLTPSWEMHRLLHHLHELGAPVAAPLHQQMVSTKHGHVGFWEWMDHTPLTAGQWGTLTGALHRVAGQLQHPRTYEPGRVFRTRLQRAWELTGTRGHPLHGAAAVVRSFEAALDVAIMAARQAAAAGPFTQVHGDNQPANIMYGRRGLALIDFERTVTAPPALDLAGLQLGLQHYQYPPGTAEDFLTGYGPQAPTLEQARPFTRIRELSGAVVAMIQAGDSPQMEQQMFIRRTAITDPGQGEPWTYISAAPTSYLIPNPIAPRSSARRHDEHTHPVQGQGAAP